MANVVDDVSPPAAAAAAAGPVPAEDERDSIEPWTESLAQGRMAVAMLVTRAKRQREQGAGVVSDAELESRRQVVRSFLWHLEFETPARPHLTQSPHCVDKALKLLFDDERSEGLVPEDISRWAAGIYEKFQRANWGAAPADDNNNDDDDDGDDDDEQTEEEEPGDETEEESDEESDPDEAGQEHPEQEEEEAPAPAPPTAPTTTTTATVAANGGIGNARLPPANHPIWGTNGIMHGLMMYRDRSGKTRYRFDPRYLNQKRDAKVFGDNGLTPGDWWPLLHVALFHGAHGHSMRGISGTPDEGAYSIVVSGSSAAYSGLDEDHGATLYYSAENSHRSRDASGATVAALAAASADTRSLQRSLLTGRPVRVLRSRGFRASRRGPSQNQNQNQNGSTPASVSAAVSWTPSVGVRYDGLYRVVEQREATNAHGGRYLQFRLRRVPGQRPLRDICDSVPSAEQEADERRIRDGY